MGGVQPLAASGRKGEGVKTKAKRRPARRPVLEPGEIVAFDWSPHKRGFDPTNPGKTAPVKRRKRPDRAAPKTVVRAAAALPAPETAARSVVKPRYREIVRTARATRLENYARSQAAGVPVGALPRGLLVPAAPARPKPAARVSEESAVLAVDGGAVATTRSSTAKPAAAVRVRPKPWLPNGRKRRKLTAKQRARKRKKALQGPKQDLRWRRLPGSFESGKRR